MLSIDDHYYMQWKSFICEILSPCGAFKCIFLRRRQAEILSQKVTKHTEFCSTGRYISVLKSHDKPQLMLI